MLRLAHLPSTTTADALSAVAARAREQGFTGLEVVLGDRCTCDLSRAVEFCLQLADSAKHDGCPISAVLLAEDPSAYIGSPVEEERLYGGARIRAALERCGWLGVQTLRITPGAVGIRGDGRQAGYQESLNQTYRTLQALRGEFERAGVVAAIEVCQNRFLLSPPEMRELLDRLHTPWIGAAMNWRACSQHGDPDDWLETLGRRVAVLVTSAGQEPPLAANGFDGSLILEG